MLWGLHSGGWMSGLYAGAADAYRAQVDLLAEHGLHATSWSVRELLAMPAGRREEVAGWLAERDIRVSLGVGGIDWLSTDDGAIRRATDETVAALRTLVPLVRAPLVSTGIDRNLHHYSRDVPVGCQIERLGVAMAPLAKACAAMGAPLAIHTVTHFGRDLAELCRRVPGLGLLVDTANFFLIGQPPVEGAAECAEYAVGTHFKDHYAAPNFKPLGLNVRGAVQGQGDVGLREIYGLLMEKAPAPDRLVMELEIDPVCDEQDRPRDRRDVLREAVAFVKSL